MKFIYLLLCLSFFAHPNAFAVSGPADITDPGPGNRPFEETKGRPFNFVQKFKAKLALKLMKKKLRNVEEGKNSGLPLIAFAASLMGGFVLIAGTPLGWILLGTGLILGCVTLAKKSKSKTDTTLAIIAIAIPVLAGLYMLFTAALVSSSFVF